MVKGNMRGLFIGLGAAVAVVSVLAVLGGAVAQAQVPRGRARMPGMAQRMPARAGMMQGPFAGLRMELRDLQLTDAQRNQVNELFKQHAQEFTSLTGQLREARQARNQTALADPVDSAALTAANTKIATLETDLLLARNKVRAEVFQLLTPEQRERAEQRRRQAQQRMQQRQQRMQQRAPAAPPAV